MEEPNKKVSNTELLIVKMFAVNFLLNNSEPLYNMKEAIDDALNLYYNAVVANNESFLFVDAFGIEDYDDEYITNKMLELKNKDNE